MENPSNVAAMISDHKDSAYEEEDEEREGKNIDYYD